MANATILPSGLQLIDGDLITELSQMRLNNSTNGITAKVNGGKSGATQLSNGVNNITVVNTANDSALLPIADGKSIVIVINSDSADSVQIFGQGTDTINGIATGTGVAQAHGITALYVSPVKGQWFRLLSA